VSPGLGAESALGYHYGMQCTTLMARAQRVAARAISILLLLAAPAYAADPCPLTRDCVEKGMCSPVDGKCVVGGDADCLQSSACVTSGTCTFKAGACVAVQCKKQNACKEHGLCVQNEDACDATDESCAASADCKSWGTCSAHFSLTTCAGSDSCDTRFGCKQWGWCESYGGDHDSDNSACGATNTQMCMDSAGCQQLGLCQKDPDLHDCRATASGCKRSRACKEGGRCDLLASTSGKATCTAQSDASCASSKACTDHKACTAFFGMCATSHPPEPQCRQLELTGLTASASSTHKPSAPYTFDASNLLDRDLRTSWQPASKKGGVGETITLTLPRAAVVFALGVGNGFQRRDTLGDLWSMNNRAARIAVTVGKETVVGTLGDGLGTRELRLPAVSTTTVTLEILSIEKGSRWNDLALSELRLYVCD